MIALPIVDTHKTEFQVAEAPAARAAAAVRPRREGGASFTLRQLHARISDLPAETAVLGLGLDGLPLLFDLRDPRPGPILVLGDKFSGKTRLLQTVVQSLILRNRPSQVQFAVLSGRPEMWQTLQQTRRDYFHCLYSNYERAAAAAILEMCDLVEARRHGEEIDRSILFLLDRMDTIPYMDFGIRMNFEWLLKEGPAVRVWPLAALDSESAVQQLRWVNRFRTRLIGAIAKPGYGRDLALSTDIKPADLIPGSQFAVRLNRSWLIFNLPDSDS